MPATTPDLVTLSAARAAELLRDGEISSVALVAALLARIETLDPDLGAIRVVLAESATEAARAADRRLAAGTPAGPLDGVPFTVKENIDVRGTATTQGVRALRDALSPDDAPAVASLRRAGAIPLARTNMPDFALRWHTDSGIAGATVNPWDPGLTPGGSSGGEAVAIATGMSMLGVGNDLGGSLRWPCQCTGIAALRPTLGRIPHALAAPPTAKPISLQLIEVQGPMARRIEDLRVAFAVMAQPDARDPWHVPLPADAGPTGPRRMHVLDRFPGVDVHPDVAAAVRRAAAALRDGGYAEDDDAPPALAETAAIWAPLMTTDAREVWPQARAVAGDGGARFMDAVLDVTPTLDVAAFSALLVTRQRLARRWSEYQQRTPLVVAPIRTQPPFAPDADLDGPDAARGIIETLQPTLIANVLGLPSVAVPVGLANGVPQAVQIIGPRFGEALCLQAAAVVEAATPPITPMTPRAGVGAGDRRAPR